MNLCCVRLNKCSLFNDKHNGKAAIKIGNYKDIPFLLALYIPERN